MILCLDNLYEQTILWMIRTALEECLGRDNLSMVHCWFWLCLVENLLG